MFARPAEAAAVGQSTAATTGCHFDFCPAEAVVVRSSPFAATNMNSVSSVHMRNHMCIARRKSWSADSSGMLLQKTQCIAVAAAIDATGPKSPWLATYHTEAQRLHRRDLRGLCIRPGGKHVQSTVLTNAPLQSGGC